MDVSGFSVFTEGKGVWCVITIMHHEDIMDKFKKNTKTDKTVGVLVIVAIVFALLTIFLSRNLTNVKTKQAQYITEAVEEVKRISKYDKTDFAFSLYEISKDYQLEAELTENNKVLFSTLDNYGTNVDHKESLSFLSQEVITVGSDRIIWLGIYDNLDYVQTFNNLFYVTASFSIIFIVLIFILFLYWSLDKQKLNISLISLGINNAEDRAMFFKEHNVDTLNPLDFIKTYFSYVFKNEEKHTEVFNNANVEATKVKEVTAVNAQILKRHAAVIKADTETSTLETTEVVEDEKELSSKVAFEDLEIEIPVFKRNKDGEITETSKNSSKIVEADKKEVKKESEIIEEIVVEEVVVVEEVKKDQRPSSKYARFTNKYDYLDNE